MMIFDIVIGNLLTVVVLVCVVLFLVKRYGQQIKAILAEGKPEAEALACEISTGWGDANLINDDGMKWRALDALRKAKTVDEAKNIRAGIIRVLNKQKEGK